MVGISKSVGRGVVGKKGKPSSDVRTVQCLLNLDRNRLESGNAEPKLILSGLMDDETQTAIDLFQSKVLKMAEPDGRVDRGGGMIKRLASALPALPTTAFIDPAWLKVAYGEEKAKVSEGKTAHDFTTNNARILEYLATSKSLAGSNYTYSQKDADGKKVTVDSGFKQIDVEDTPWCACFVNWCLIQAGAKRGPGAAAKEYRKYGVEAARGQVGAICAIYREPFNDSATGNHVGFYIAGNQDEGYVGLLGGNQDNKVCRKWFVGIDPFEIKMRWPLGA